MLEIIALFSVIHNTQTRSIQLSSFRSFLQILSNEHNNSSSVGGNSDSRLSKRLVAIRRSLLQRKHFSVHAIY